MSLGFVERYCNDSVFFSGQLLSMVFVNFLAWQEEGMKGVKAPWNESSHDFWLFFCQKLSPTC